MSMAQAVVVSGSTESSGHGASGSDNTNEDEEDGQDQSYDENDYADDDGNYDEDYDEQEGEEEEGEEGEDGRAVAWRDRRRGGGGGVDSLDLQRRSKQRPVLYCVHAIHTYILSSVASMHYCSRTCVIILPTFIAMPRLFARLVSPWCSVLLAACRFGCRGNPADMQGLPARAVLPRAVCVFARRSKQGENSLAQRQCIERHKEEKKD